MSAVVTVSIDLTSPNLTDQDKAVLAALGLTPGGDWPPAPAPAAVVNMQSEETTGRRAELLADAAETPAAEEKPAPKPRRSRAKKAEETAETGGPAALEDLPTATRSEAIEWAIKLSDKGLKDDLRQVLDQIGAERASTITDGEQAAQFISLTKTVLAAQPAAPAEEAPAEEAPAEEAPAEEAPAEEAPAPAGRTLQDAIDAAMALVKDNKGSIVRTAVGSLGVAKVSAMTEDQVPEFFTLLDQLQG